MVATPITVLVVDDERLARQRVRALLCAEPDVEIVSECSNGLEALAAITALNPDLVYLDVQMPDLDGLGVLAALGADETPEIIFVTAHSAYMERAFEVHAVDYLRKPYQNARFTSALTHARRRVHAKRAEQKAPIELNSAIPSSGPRYGQVLAALHDGNTDQRIALQDGRTGTWHIVRRDEIHWIGADGSSRVIAHVGKEGYTWKRTLSELEHVLDPRIFLRIHRSYIVNTRHIRQIKPLLKGEFAIILAEGTVLDTGRTYRDAIESFLHERSDRLSAGEDS